MKTPLLYYRQIPSDIINSPAPKSTKPSRNKTYKMRPEQHAAVAITSQYFTKYGRLPKTSQNDIPEGGSLRAKHARPVATGAGNAVREEMLSEVASPAPRFLWNAKMRFGKTFTAYQLAKKMGWKRILILTYKPATEKSWSDDLAEHVDFKGWQFIGGREGWNSANENTPINEENPVVWFASYQDVLGRIAGTGEIKKRHKRMRETNWDCIIVDEYHFGAWRDTAKELTREDGADKNPLDNLEVGEMENTLPFKVGAFLYLSGTPFRAIADGEFSEDQIYNWTYADEQRAKKSWVGKPAENNPYLELPGIVMLTYQIPDRLRNVATLGEWGEFDLNKFFSAKKTDKGEIVFEFEQDVQKFLNFLRGKGLNISAENKSDHRRPALPFEDARLLSTLTHTFWFLPNVAACKAMEKLLNNDPFYNNYKIIRIAGSDTKGGKNALSPVEKAIGDGLETKTITLSCGKLTTGVTVPQWSGVLFLRNTESPETYFQTAFRAQSPWSPFKPTCYLLDFAPSRALKLMANYSNELASLSDTRSPALRLSEFIEFMPVLCYDGVSMQKLNENEILDISTYGTASTMLARRWQSARLIDVNTNILERVSNSSEILTALENIEDFRNLKNDLTRVVKSEKLIIEAKRKKIEHGEAPELSEAQKKKDREIRKFKKALREKLLKFITRIPIFMYLTDYREEKLTDVINELEPELFTKVTGLTKSDFTKMCEIGVFNQMELNAAIAQFRRFEDSSLTYAGGRILRGDDTIGLFDRSITRTEADRFIEAIVA